MAAKILLVEDDADLRLGLALRLRGQGYEVYPAEDGAQGLFLAQRARPDLILLDLGLPAGDGIAILRRLRALGPLATVPVLILSGWDPASERAAEAIRHSVGYLHKPVDNEELLRLVREHTAHTGIAAAKLPKVLVVEDDADTRLGLTLRLKASGYEVASAADGATAFTAAVRERPDVVLLDLGLPAGDGYSVLARLKSSPVCAPIPVVVLSARDESVHREQALRAGAEAYLQKPTDNPTLLKVLARVREPRTALAA